jgi:pterin-4a-carbinolamine dehydratase
MSSPIFISYRRDDAAAEAIALSTALRNRFGDDAVFMDTKSLLGGDEWPDVLGQAVNDAETIVVVIGPEWIRISDQWGRRRIDQADDWVRRELVTALGAATKQIIPVLVRGAQLPPPDAVPPEMRALLTRQVIEIRRDYWNHDIQLLLAQLDVPRASSAAVDRGGSPYPHNPPEGPDPADPERLERALGSELKAWERLESALPEDPSLTRVELYREFRFKSFPSAISFMALVAPGCEIAMHHPRWENIFKTLRVYLTTWDIGHRISDRDLQLARYFDRAYAEFDGRVDSPARRPRQVDDEHHRATVSP